MKNKLKYIYLSIVATLIFVFTFTMFSTNTYAMSYNSSQEKLQWSWANLVYTQSNSKLNNVDITIIYDDFTEYYLYGINITLEEKSHYTENYQRYTIIRPKLDTITGVTYNQNDNNYYHNNKIINTIAIEEKNYTQIAINYRTTNDNIYNIKTSIELYEINTDIRLSKVNDSYQDENIFIHTSQINSNTYEYYSSYKTYLNIESVDSQRLKLTYLNNISRDYDIYYNKQVKDYAKVSCMYDSNNTLNYLNEEYFFNNNWYTENKYNTVQQQFSQLQAQYNILSQQYEDLATTYNTYINNHSYTNDYVESLRSSLEDTQEEYANYQNTHSYTNQQYQDIQTQLTELQSQYNTLQDEYENYQNTHSYTNQQYQNLQAQIEYLLGRIQSLQDSLNQLKARTSLSYLINGATIKLVDTISGVLYSETISINTNQTTFTYNDLSQNFKDAIDNNIQSMVTYDLYITLNNATDTSFITEMNDPYRNHNYIGLTYEGQTWNSKIYQPIEDNNYILVNPMGFVYNEITLNTFDDNNRYFNIALNVDNYYYQNGYTNGYDTGYANGLENGDIAQYNDGYTDGYEEGYTTGANSSNTLYNMVISIVDTPISIFKQIFNFDVLGINLVQIFTMIISLLIIIWLIKKLI